mmetsp:Transcript_68094/g.175542  ORF Transcript_68094/g.175542 Transcript_68094/m.175542 type:complete len:436 (+) Transcript_68094:121-1428(+)
MAQVADGPLVWEAMIWGFLSAISLTIGSVIGTVRLPSAKIRAALMAYGGGALLFALSVELFGHTLEKSQANNWNAPVWVMEFSALAGGAIFMSLGRALEAIGARLRKPAADACCPVRSEDAEAHGEPAVLCASEPPARQATEPDLEDAGTLESSNHEPAKLCVCRGCLSGRSCELELASTWSTAEPSSEPLSPVSPHLPKVLPGSPMPGEVLEDLTLLELEEAIVELFVPSMHKQDAMKGKVAWQADDEEAAAVRKPAWLGISSAEPAGDLDDRGKQAALMVWLGILIDAVPESLVIGILVNRSGGEQSGSAAAAALPFVVGVFLSNLPESMSASGSMKAHGMRVSTILLMWFSIVVITTLGAGVGAVIFPRDAMEDPTSELAIAGIEGLAGGAMLTMIAQTLLPEAHEHGGELVGMSCLVGFLSALSVKMLPGA